MSAYERYARYLQALKDAAPKREAEQGDHGSTAAGKIVPPSKSLITRGPIPQWERRAKRRPEVTLTLEQETEPGLRPDSTERGR